MSKKGLFKPDTSIKHDDGVSLDRVSNLKIMHSNAGYYIGTTYLDKEMNMHLPYSRNTDYTNNKDEAQVWLDALTATF